MGKHFDIVDGGIAATFSNGPKAGQVGVVTPEDGIPPKTLEFLAGLIYERTGKCKVKALDAEGRPVTYNGVIYRMAPRCPFAVKLRRELAVANAQKEIQE